MSVSGLETIAQGDGSRVETAGSVVARSEAEWQALWTAHAGALVPPPAVDFRSRMVAAVFAGEQPSAGFGIGISGSRRDGASLVLLVDHRQPKAGDLTAQIIASPFHIVSLPRHEGEVRFVPLNGQPAARARRPAAPADQDAAPSSTGLSPAVAGALAYLAGPFSGAVVLASETSSTFVRFHAWQALLGLGILGVAALIFLLLGFALLVVSPMAFWAMLWLAAITAGLWVLLWAASLVQAYRGLLWRWPLVGRVAERRSRSRSRN